MSFATVIIVNLELRIKEIEEMEKNSSYDEAIDEALVNELKNTIKMIRKEYNEYVD